MVKDVDKFTKSEAAEKIGLSSHTDLLARLIASWLSNIDESYALFDTTEIMKSFLAYSAVNVNEQ